MKILYIWQAAFPWDVRADKICRELHRRGCAVTILARWKPGQPPEADYQGVRIVRVGHGLPGPLSLPVPGNPVWTRAIRTLLDTWRPDAVIAREVLLAEPAARAAGRRGTPMIIDMAEHYPATMRTWDKYKKGAMRLLVFRLKVPDLVERRAVRHADGIITVCDEQIDRLAREFGYPPDRTAVVHNTLEADAFRDVRKGSSRPPRVFAHHGYITSQRGLSQLVRGFGIAATHDPDIELLIAGSGDSSELARIAGELGVADRVRILGPYRHDELTRLYSETDIGVLAYPTDESWAHTLPNKLFDYLACGKPVIVSPVPSFRRIVQDARAGLVLESNAPDDIARGILQMRRMDPESMSVGGLTAARNRYHWEQDAEELIRFLGRYITVPSPERVSLAPNT